MGIAAAHGRIYNPPLRVRKKFVGVDAHIDPKPPLGAQGEVVRLRAGGDQSLRSPRAYNPSAGMRSAKILRESQLPTGGYIIRPYGCGRNL